MGEAILELEMALLLKMGAVLLLLMLALCGLRRVAMLSASRGRGFIRMVESKAVGQNQTLYLVQVGQQSFLLGGSKESLTLLTEVSNLPVPAEEGDHASQTHWLAAKLSGDWMSTGSKWISWWRDRFSMNDRRSARSNGVDRI